MQRINVSGDLIFENNHKLRAAAQTVACLRVCKAFSKFSFVDLRIVRFELDFVVEFNQFPIGIC